MKKTSLLYLALTLLLSWGIASASTNPGVSIPIPIILDQGGPDAFGYHWIDNDSAGGPAYNWIDISSIGVQVTGLADDNNVGPFQMGFDFPYYWYTVDHMWIGSNGYISFSSNANFAHPFANIPYNGNPNDLVAVLTGDLDFSRGIGTCYYYTNNADSFIVSWINVREFGYDSTHTFQLILSASDSSLTFQYGENHGNFLDSNGQNMDVIGIENVNGQVGIQYLRNNAPSNHMWHDGLALRFYPIPDPDFVVHDFGVLDGFHDGSGADFIHDDSSYTIRVLVKNFGNQFESALRTSCIIRRGTTVVYHDTLDLAAMDPGEMLWVEYPDRFTVDSVITYKVAFATLMLGDQNSNNNSLTFELDGYRLPQELRYCDDIGEASRSWTGDFSGFGLEFQVPETLRVTRASINVVASVNGPAYVWFLPDDGTGMPDQDNILAADTADITTSGWVDFDFSWATNLYFAPNAKFWLVAVHAFMNTFAFSMDQTVPLSYRGWEYTGGLAPDRDRGISDIMFKIFADTVHVEAGPGCEYLVGDINGNGATNGIDVTYGVGYFKGGPAPPDVCDCPPHGQLYAAGDVNGNCVFNGIDITYFVSYLKGGPALLWCTDCPPARR